MPEAKERYVEKLTDLDIALETAWAFIELRGWAATPQLLFALKQYTKDRVAEKG
jgi:hypothetical protein